MFNARLCAGQQAGLPRKAAGLYASEVVFRLAVQAIVLRDFDELRETLDSNSAGTVNVLEAVRLT
ncbi:MAG: hypothetical protein JSW03_09905 [Candidatus Eiseniibacteriota bacterium]|nr:MAG: hypothetical protein JSW03_09905 [Candidatus Eisenbacteria bacterium]